MPAWDLHNRPRARSARCQRKKHLNERALAGGKMLVSLADALA